MRYTVGRNTCATKAQIIIIIFCCCGDCLYLSHHLFDITDNFLSSSPEPPFPDDLAPWASSSSLYSSALHGITLTADSGGACTVWIESTVTSTLPLLSAGASEHGEGICFSSDRVDCDLHPATIHKSARIYYIIECVRLMLQSPAALQPGKAADTAALAANKPISQ